MRIGRETEAIGLADFAGLDEAIEIFVEGERARIARAFQQGLDFLELSFEDQRLDGGVGEKDFLAYAAAGIRTFGLSSSLYKPGLGAAEVRAKARAVISAYETVFDTGP